MLLYAVFSSEVPFQSVNLEPEYVIFHNYQNQMASKIHLKRKEMQQELCTLWLSLKTNLKSNYQTIKEEQIMKFRLQKISNIIRYYNFIHVLSLYVHYTIIGIFIITISIS